MSLIRRLAAEMLGTSLLLATVVGSGLMAGRLSGGNAAIALLANALATGAILGVLVAIFAPVSGAHFNPAVSLWFLLRRRMRGNEFCLYLAAQFCGAVLGVLTAHAMFAQPLFEISAKLRSGPAQWLSEFIATAGLLATIGGAERRGIPVAPLAGSYIAGAYWFTASTSFANPAATIARMMTDSFAGIAPASAPGFLLAELAAVLCALPLLAWLFAPE